MNEERRASSFDELARGLASGEVSRRKAFRLLGGALLGGTLASIPGAAWATHRGRPHGPPSATCPNQGEMLVCQCPSGQELCGGACVPSCGTGFQRDQTSCTCVQATCGPDNCDRGCCDSQGVCRSLIDVCGYGGEACFTCPPNEECVIQQDRLTGAMNAVCQPTGPSPG